MAGLSTNSPLPSFRPETRTGAGGPSAHRPSPRRCPFRYGVPIPCLNNLDIYKQTAAAPSIGAAGRCACARAGKLKLNTRSQPSSSKLGVSLLGLPRHISPPSLSIITSESRRASEQILRFCCFMLQRRREWPVVTVRCPRGPSRCSHLPAFEDAIS